MLYLSQAIGRPVLDATGEPIGKVADLIVAVGDRYPPVTGLVVATDRRRIFLPWSQVAQFDASRRPAARPTRSTSPSSSSARTRSCSGADLLDKQIVDIDGRKVVRVNDLRLDEIEGKLHLVAVDVGAAGLLRRLGLEGAVPDARAQPAPADARALHRLGGRRPGRDAASPRSGCACRTPAWPSSTRPTWPRSSTSSRRATGPASWPRSTTRPSPTRSRRWSPRPRSRSSRTSSPERAADILEEMSPGRRRRPRGRPVGRDARGAPGADGARRGGRARRAARLPGGHGGRDDDDRVRGRPRRR